MPHKKAKNKVQVFGEIEKEAHDVLKHYKEKYHLPMYRIVSLAILYALSSKIFAEMLAKITIENPFWQAKQKGEF